MLRNFEPNRKIGEEFQGSILAVFALLCGEILLIIVYLLFFHLGLLSDYAQVLGDATGWMPYISNSSVYISANVRGYISAYYIASIFLILTYVFFCFRRRRKKLRLIVCSASLIIFGTTCFPWLYGIKLRRFDFSRFHEGHVFEHLMAAFGIAFVAWIACHAAFDTLGTTRTNREHEDGAN